MQQYSLNHGLFVYYFKESGVMNAKNMSYTQKNLDKLDLV